MARPGKHQRSPALSEAYTCGGKTHALLLPLYYSLQGVSPTNRWWIMSDSGKMHLKVFDADAFNALSC